MTNELTIVVPEEKKDSFPTIDQMNRGLRFLEAYEQLEREGFKGDIYTAIVERVFPNASDEEKKTLRWEAKDACYAQAYGMSGGGITRQLGMTQQVAEICGRLGRRQQSGPELQHLRPDPRLKGAREVVFVMDDVSSIERRILVTLADAGIPAQKIDAVRGKVNRLAEIQAGFARNFPEINRYFGAETKASAPYYPPAEIEGDGSSERSAARSRMLKQMNNHGKPWQRRGKGKR